MNGRLSKRAADIYGCYHDMMQEMIGELRRKAHDEGECEGAPRCGDCLDEQYEKDEAKIDGE